MVILLKRGLALIILICFPYCLVAQYTLNGNATQDACNAYSLTQEAGTQHGSVWNNIKIDLTQSFDFNFDVYLGRPQTGGVGADGIVFVLQPISTSVGTTGGGLGYEGISPAVGVTLDTYQNAGNNDPSYDHIAIQLNGDLDHNSANNIAGPVTAINGNNDIEDNAWHALRIQWDATTKTFSAYIDGSLRVSVVRDFVNTVFGGNPLVYWGFTGSTGGEFNHQQFKTALNPSFTFSPTQKKCINEPITFNSTTISFTTIAKFYWDFGDGSPIDSANLNPVHTYITAGNFTVKQRVVGADGCEATNTQVVLIGSKPVADFSFNDNCINRPLNNPLIISDNSSATFGTVNYYYWDLGNGQIAWGTFQTSLTANFSAPGDKNIKHFVKTSQGCESDTLNKVFHLYGSPVADFTFTDSVCLGQPTSFFGSISPAVGDTAVLTWHWIYNGGPWQDINILNSVYTFTTPGNQPALLVATPVLSPTCNSLKPKSVFIVNKPTAYFKYNNICQATATTFTDSSYTSDGTPVNQWWWNLGSNGISTQTSPPATYPVVGTDTIRLVVHNSKGCISDTLKQAIVINSKPTANFGYSTPVCNGSPVQFWDSSKVTGSTITKWSWVYNGVEFSSSQNSNHSFGPGSPTVKLVVTSGAGCISDTAFKTFVVNPNPDVTINFKNACKNAVIDFKAIDNSGTVSQWKWLFGDGATAITQNAQHAYSANGTYKVKLYATAANGCFSDSLTGDITIFSTNVFAGKDTIAAAGQPVQLNATGGLSYSWTPAMPLSDPNIGNPIAILNTTQTFTVKAFTPEGCESYDDVTVNIYKGPDIYLPNAFTPNGDAINDLFKGIPVGIKQFNYLKVFNRWGQLIFSSSDYNKAWDGTWHGQNQPSGVYVVLANGIDFKGNIIDKRQTIMLIR
jgi:gliding motility-associated-like protein